MAILGNERVSSYRGYYSLEEAFSTVRDNVGPNYFISTLLKGKSSMFDKTYVEEE